MNTDKEIEDFVNAIIPKDTGLVFNDLVRPSDGYANKEVVPVLAFSLDILRDGFDLDLKTIGRAFNYHHATVLYYIDKTDDLLNKDQSMAWLHKQMVELADQTKSILSSFKKDTSFRVTDVAARTAKTKEKRTSSSEAKLASLTKGRLQRILYLMEINKPRQEVQDSCGVTNQMYNTIKNKKEQIIKDNFKYIKK